METVISLRMDCLHWCSDDGIFDARNVCSGRWTDTVIDDHPPDPPICLFLFIIIWKIITSSSLKWKPSENLLRSSHEVKIEDEAKPRPAFSPVLSLHPLHCDRQHKQQNQGKVWWYLTLFLCRALQGSIHPLPPPSPPSQACSSLSVLFLLLLHWYPPLKSPPYDRISFTHITFLLPNFLKKKSPLNHCVYVLDFTLSF